MTFNFRILCLAVMMATCSSAMYADSDVTAELRDQNTPSGWTAVSLPSIPEITASNTFNITSYGASTSSEDNATAINNAISAANSAGGGMVVIPEGTWLSGPITMKSKVVLHINAGATLKMLEFGKYPDNTTHEKTYNSGFSYKDYTFIGNGSSAVDDVIIEGEGETSVIDGQGAPWWAQVEAAKAAGSSFDRPACIRFKKGTRHLFRNFKTQNTPGVNITIGNKTKAGHVTIHDVWISNPDSEASSGASHNTDGIPIWEPYVNIYNCNISTGDDNIVVDSEGHHIHAWNINCGYGHGMSVGSYTVDVHDVIYEGVTFNNTGSGFRIKTSADRSGNDQTGSNGAVKNLICRNATMTGCPSPIKITSWYDKDVENPSSNTTSAVTETTPEFCNILFQNITETTGKSGATSWKHNRPVYLYGRPEMPVHDITLDNVNINSYLGMFLAFAKNVTFKNGCKITNKKNSSSLLTTEYQAYSDDGSTLISATPSKYNGSETATTHAVKFMNGSTVYKTYNICPNSYAYPPAAPTKSGYTFKGWATSEGGSAVSLAATELAAGGTFYAVWESNGSGGGLEPEDTPATPVTVMTKKAFDFIVGRDGDADAAIAAANAATGSYRYYIFVPNGTYDMTTTQQWTLGSDKSAITGTDNSTVSPGSTFQNNAIWLTRSNVSIIGQSENSTKLRNTPIYPGISYTSTLEIRSGKTNTYIQDLTLYNNYANGANDKGVAVAFYDRGTNTILKNVNCWSNQDTYTSAATRCYYENSTFAGTVDFICGSGDVWFEKCDLVINNRNGNVITAPSTLSTENWGYVFNSCTISKAEGATKVTDKNWNLGRPWKNSPASTFINTTMNVLPNDAGWTSMSNGLVIRFHEYGSKNSSGTALDLSSRSISACSGADTSDDPVLTAAQAATYTVDAVVGNNGAWSPKSYTAQVGVTNVALNGSTLLWDDSDYALCWVVFKDGEYYANPITNSLTLTEDGSYTVRAANAMGGLGEASSAVEYVDDTKGTVAATVKMTWVDYDNPTVSKGEVTTAQAGYNTISNGSVAMANTTWSCNWITYIKVDASNVPADRYIKKATLTAKVSGSTDSKRTTTWGAGYNGSVWSSTMTYESADRSITTCGNTYTTSTKSATTFEDVTFDISDALVGEADKIATILIYETAAAGGYIKDVAVSVEYTDEAPAATQYTVSASGVNGTVVIKNGDAVVTSGSLVDNGTELTFTATPATGYTFTKWSDDNNDNPRTVTVNGDNVSLTAVFEKTVVAVENFSMTTPSSAPSSISDMTVTGGSISDKNSTTKALAFDKNGVKFGGSACQLQVTLNSAIKVGTKVSISYTNTSSDKTTGLGLFDSNVQNVVINLANNISSGSSGTAEYVFNATDETYIGQNTFVITRNGGSGGLAVSTIEVTIDMPEVITATVVSTRTFGSFSSMYNVDFSDAQSTDMIAAYTVKYNGSNSVKLTRHRDVLPAGTGVVLYAPTATKEWSFATVAETNATVGENDMVGVPVATSVATSVEKSGKTYYSYGLSGDAFHPLESTGTIPGGKAYLSIPREPSTSSSGSAKGLIIGFGDSTGIEEVNKEDGFFGNGKVYNLQGVEINGIMKNGIYIINGKKMLVK